VLVQIPHGGGAGAARDRLDQGYPPGSRIVFAAAPCGAPNVRVLSEGLYAAGGPVLAYDGERVYFAGKTGAASEWQIYEARVHGAATHLALQVAGRTAVLVIPRAFPLVFSLPGVSGDLSFDAEGNRKVALRLLIARRGSFVAVEPRK